MRRKHLNRRGQSLIELLIAVVVGSIMVVGAIAVIAPALKSHTDVSRAQVAIALGNELLQSIRVLSESSWHNLANLSTSSANHYYLNTTSSPFSVAAGDESVAVSTSTYTRYFFVDDVGRDGSGKILASGGTYDPSTKKVTVVYRWSPNATGSVASYLTRSRNNIFIQTDWSGGAGQNGPATTTNNKFATSSVVNFTTTTGSIIIEGVNP